MKKSLILFVLFLSLYATRAEAQNTAAQAKEKWCKNITTTIDTRIAKYNNNSEIYIKRYEARKKQIEDLMTKLSSKYDTSKVMDSLINIDLQLQKLSADYKTYIEALELTKKQACGYSQGQFALVMKDAGMKLGVVFSDIIEMNNYWQRTVRPELETFKNSIK